MNYIDLDGLEPAEPPGGQHTAFNPPDTPIHVTPTDEVAGVSNQIQVDNILYNQLPQNPVADMAIEFIQGIMEIASDMGQQAVLEVNMARYSTNSTFAEPDLPDASNTTNTPELTTDEIDPNGDRFNSGGGMTIHDVLDVIGLIPVLGELADLTNASLYADKGDYTNAAISTVAAVPFAGYVASATKLAKKAGGTPSLVAQARLIKHRLNADRNSVGILLDNNKRMRIDLAGASHKGISTPHVQIEKLHVSPYNSDLKRYSTESTRPAT